MNPPHHDDYLHTQLHGYQADEASPAHHLPFDRISPEEPTLGAAGEFGEYMPQADLSGTAADTGGETPASDPAADGDDEDVHVAHAADVEVQRAVADETQQHGDEREDQAAGVEAQHREEEPAETHAYEGHAADIEVPRAVVNETHAHGVDLYEEPAGDAHVHDAAVTEWQADEGSVAEVEASDAEVQLAVADERDVQHADTYQEPSGDAEVHDAVAGEAHASDEEATGEPEHHAAASEAHAQDEERELHAGDAQASKTHAGEAHESHVAGEHQAVGEQSDEEHLHEEPMHADDTYEGHAHDEHAHDEHAHEAHAHEGHAHDETDHPDHQDAAGVDAERHVESEDEEQAAVLMQAGPPDATMEESDVIAGAHAAHDTPHDDATGASESVGANGAATAEQTLSMASAHPAVHPSVTEHISSAGDARGMLEGVAQSLRTLAGRDAKGEGIAIFPRGVDVLEVRMHISRDRDIDLNFRVAGPTVPGTSI